MKLESKYLDDEKNFYMEIKDGLPQQLFVSHTMRPDAGLKDRAVNQTLLHQIYDQVKENPKSGAIWDTVVSLTHQEKIDGNEIYLPTVSTEEMITLGRSIQNDQTQSDRYHHMLERSSDGKLWYDIIFAENTNVIDSILPLLRLVTQMRGRKFGSALDIGTGTGNVVQKIAPFCSSLVGIDVLPEAIAIASTRADIKGKAEFHVGNATKLQFPDESMDLVLSNGVTVYMTKNEEMKQNEEIHRILRPDGMYVMVNGVSEDLNTRDIHGAKELLETLIGVAIKDNAPLFSEQMTLGDARQQFLDKGYRQMRPLVKDKNWIVGLIKPRI